MIDPDADLTDEEERALRSLERLAKHWPRTLSLFGASGWLSIRKGGGGSQYQVAYLGGDYWEVSGGDGSDEF